MCSILATCGMIRPIGGYIYQTYYIVTLLFGIPNDCRLIVPTVGIAIRLSGYLYDCRYMA